MHWRDVRLKDISANLGQYRPVLVLLLGIAMIAMVTAGRGVVGSGGPEGAGPVGDGGPRQAVSPTEGAPGAPADADAPRNAGSASPGGASSASVGEAGVVGEAGGAPAVAPVAQPQAAEPGADPSGSASPGSEPPSEESDDDALPVDPPPMPNVPDEANPAMASLAPVSSPICGNVGLVFIVGVLVLAATGEQEAEEALRTGLEPIFHVCAQFPVPHTDTTCPVDDEVEATTTETMDAAGVESPLGDDVPLPIPPFAALGTLLDVMYAVEIEVEGASGASAGVVSELGDALECRTDEGASFIYDD